MRASQSSARARHQRRRYARGAGHRATEALLRAISPKLGALYPKSGGTGGGSLRQGARREKVSPAVFRKSRTEGTKVAQEEAERERGEERKKRGAICGDGPTSRQVTIGERAQGTRAGVVVATSAEPRAPLTPYTSRMLLPARCDMPLALLSAHTRGARAPAVYSLSLSLCVTCIGVMMLDARFFFLVLFPVPGGRADREKGRWGDPEP